MESEEVRNKIKVGVKRAFENDPTILERMRVNVSKAIKEQWKTRKLYKQSIQIDNIIYPSIRNASISLNIKGYIIKTRCSSGDWPNYFYINSNID